MLRGPQQKFCEGIVTGLTAADAYRAAYPKSSEAAARAHGARLVAKGNIKAEVARMRAKAEEKAGSAVLTLVEKRSFLARVVRARLGEGMIDADLVQAIDVERRKDGKGWKDIHKIRVCDKLAAIEKDNDLAGEGSEAGKNDEFSELLKELRK
jgi:hypothetical protein